jgi:ABC-2 type transport system permease protein
MNPRRIFADFLVAARGYMRSPIGLFFSLFFPVILIVLFGFIFSGGSQTVTLYAENLDHNSPVSVAFLDALNKTGVVVVSVVPATSGNLSGWLANNSDPVGLVIPSGFQSKYLNHTSVAVQVYVDPADASSSGYTEGAVQGVINGFNLKAANGTTIVTSQTANVGSPVYKYIDYLVPGLIGFSILTSPMFALVEITSTYRKEHIFRQLSLTPLTRGEWLIAKVLWYTVLTLMSAAIMITIGVLGFHAHVSLTLGLLPFLVIGPVFFVALGMLAGSAAKTPETAAVIGNVITFPMMFLSGTFFPVSSFGPALATVAHILPLYYVIDGMNQVMLYGNLGRALIDFLIVAVGAAIIFAAAVRVFKWRDE